MERLCGFKECPRGCPAAVVVGKGKATIAASADTQQTVTTLNAAAVKR
jgi:hypothetical protein